MHRTMNHVLETDARPERSKSQQTQAQHLGQRTGVREVRAGCIGRGQAGKTALFRAMTEGPIGEYFPSGLHVDVGNPKEAAQMIREAEATRALLEMSGLPPTLEPSEIRYYLYDGDDQRVTYHMREVIGQILTHTLPDSDAAQQTLYDEYLQSLLDTQVLWAVIPCPPPDPNARDRRRYANDLRLTSAYLREALRHRPPGRSCAVALVLTKIDTLFDNPEDARAALTPEVLTASLGPLVNTVRRSTRVEDAAIIPVTSFGFGNAIQRSLPAGEENPREMDAPNGPFGGEPTWLLKDGVVMEPHNLSTLMIWTLLYGLLNQEVASDAIEPELAEVCQMLDQDLHLDERWLVPIKGRLAGQE